MSTPAHLNKLPECRYCRFFAENPYLVCAIHPVGPEGDRCLDFREDDSALKHWNDFLGLDWSTGNDDRWQPDGDPVYVGEFVLQSQRRLTVEEQRQLLDSHPAFTGRCPDCDYSHPLDEPVPLHWCCPQCGWQDER